MALFVVSLVALSGCGVAVQVKTAHDPRAPHASYKTFAMMEANRPLPTKSADTDPFVMQRLRQITYTRMVSRGFVPVKKSEADLLVGVFATQDERYTVYSSPAYGAYGPYGYDPYFGPSLWSTQVSRFEESIVVIDLVDQKKRAVVWRGTGGRAVQSHMNEDVMQEIVGAILERYPPRIHLKAQGGTAAAHPTWVRRASAEPFPSSCSTHGIACLKRISQPYGFEMRSSVNPHHD